MTAADGILDSQITLWDLPGLKQPTILTNLKNVQSFGVHSSLQLRRSLVPRKKKNPAGTEADEAQPGEAEEVLVSTLVVGCRKRVAVMSWSGGKPLGGTKVRASSHFTHSS
jgi:hypothetical protein